MKPLDKKVFVIIVTYNGAKWIDKCITSLQQSSYPVRILVLDNNSADDTTARIKKYPEVQLIATGSNLGFGRANNMGMAEALRQGADYVFLLNQDAYVFNDTIGSLVNKAALEPQAGIISPLHYAANETDFDAGFAMYYQKVVKERGHNLAEVPFVNAAAWLLTRACIEKVGFFEPLFSHYGEDRNYCSRVLYHKFLILIDKDAGIVHDRVVVRNFRKDVVQSKYKILATLLDVNRSFAGSYAMALREVFGLPKYFTRFYGFGKGAQLLAILSLYYSGRLLWPSQVYLSRKKAR